MSHDSRICTSRFRRSAAQWIVLSLCVVALSGCMSRRRAANNENFKRALNAYFYNGHDDCLYKTAIKFPNEVSVKDKQQMREMDALAKAGLLTRVEDGAFNLVHYSLTPMGTRATSRFCYGHRDVTSVESFTPPYPVGARKSSDVTYRYRLVDSPQWLSDENLSKEFPKLAAQAGGNAEGKTTVMTAYNGWEVPDYGKPVIE